ncbi:amino acid transporter [Mycena rosella]|uniref:Amino acid transporter n=1 Tax=Mycena rosella TaxID=1033263 RepID=A0AAD7GUE9_MYCRO|nr:amino acid transporter [Mycena rosella]
MEENSKFNGKPSDAQSISEKGDVHVLDVDTAKLAELGYKSEFKREFSLLETCAFSFSIMGIMASISATLSFGLVAGGHVGLVWGWFIPCCFVIFVALSMAELASSMPTSAGLYYFSAKLAPEKYVGLASWANITGQVALVCGIDFTCAEMITTAIAVGSDGTIHPSPGATYGILVAILISHGIVCSASTRILARLNILYVLVNVGTSVATIIALLVVAGENKVSTKDAFTLFENNTGWTNRNGWCWTYSADCDFGECQSAVLSGYLLRLKVAVGATSALGWILLITISFVIPSVGDILSSRLPLPAGQVFLDVLGKRGMLAIWSCATLTQYACGCAQGGDASRVVFAFARDNAQPLSRWWKKMSSNAVPVNAVWLVIFCASVIGLYTSYAVPIFLRITSGRDKFVPGPFSLGRWSTPIGAIAVAWVVFIEVVLIFPGGQVTTAETMNYSVLIVMAVFLFATVSWLTSAHKWFRGPVRNIDDVAEKCST